MKVLQLGKFYPIRGGVEKVMHDLTVGLSKRQIHCDMLCASTENYPSGTIVLNDYARVIVEHTQIKAAATMLAPSMIMKLRKIAKQYDIIHVHHPDPMAGLALMLSGYKGKVVLHWHLDILKQKTLLKFYMPIQNWLIRRADIIVGTTPVYVAESSHLQKVQHKVDYIPIGVAPLENDQEKVSCIRNKYKDKTLIFSLGRLVEYKGYEYLIRSLALLDDSFQLLIGGKGPLMDSLENLIKELNLENRVTLLGFVADEDIANYYDAADIFGLSSISKNEAFAIVQVEAMCFGKPVVCAHIPESGVSWVNADGESGLVVEKENPQALADAFVKIAGDPSLHQKLSEGARRRFETYFTLDKMVDKMEDVYKKILK